MLKRAAHNLRKECLRLRHCGHFPVTEKLNISGVRELDDLFGSESGIHEYGNSSEFLDCPESQNPVHGISAA